MPAGIEQVLRADSAEEALLGLCLRDPEAFSAARTLVHAADIAQEELREIYGAMERVADRGDVPLTSTVSDELKRRPDTARLAGLRLSVRVFDLMAGAVGPGEWAGTYAREVLRARTRRLLLVASGQIAEWASESTLSAGEAVKLALEALAALPQDHRSGPVVLTADALADVGVRVVAGDHGEVLPLGFTDLDRLLSGGSRPGQLILVGGRPGAGKSAFLRDVARHFARRGPVLFASNEMDEGGIVARDLAALSNVALGEILRGQVRGPDRLAIDAALAEIRRTTLTTFVDGAMTTLGLKTRALELSGRGGLVAIVVDYLQRMADPGRTTIERVGYTVRSLKALAMELRIPVLVGSQLNRGGERADHDKPPTLIDLRDSGELEQEADIVLLLHRLSYYYPSPDLWRQGGKTGPWPGGEADMWIGKQRQGESGVSVKLAWLASRATFGSLTREAF